MMDSTAISLLGMGKEELASFAKSLGEPAYRADQIREAVYRQRVESIDEITTLSQALRQKLSDQGISVGAPED